MVVATTLPKSFITSHQRKPSGKTQYAHFGDHKWEILEPRLLDVIFEWMAERHSIFERRLAGAPSPWTEDPVMRRYAFTNVYRLLDRNTQYLLRHVIDEGGSQDVTETTFRTILFRMFNKIETWELFVEALGPVLSWANFDRRRYEEVIEEALERPGGYTPYTSAHQVSAPHLGGQYYYQNHLRALEAIMSSGTPAIMARQTHLEDAFEIIRKLPGYGPFFANQLSVDLSYTPGVNYGENDWAAAGPGSKNCLKKLFGPSVSSHLSEAMIWLYSIQESHWERLGYTPTLLDKNGVVMRKGVSVVDIEHSLCEVEKWTRVGMPWLKGDRTDIKKAADRGEHGTGNAAREESAVTLYYPAKWAPGFVPPLLPPLPGDAMDEDELTELEDEEWENGADGDTYEVSHIIKERNGGRQFLVRWVGYGPEDDLWMPVEELERSCADVLAKWRDMQRALNTEVARIRGIKQAMKANDAVKRVVRKKTVKRRTR